MFLSMVTEIQSKRQERKRRSTANPAYSGLLETEVLYHSLFLPQFYFMAIKGLNASYYKRIYECRTTHLLVKIY